VFLAVSGGADSMALLCIFALLASKLEVALAVAHLDHGLRSCSWQEAELVEQYCQQLKLPLYACTTDVGAYCRENNLGLEAGAREVRHQWLKEAAAAFDAQRIATAHHRDDQAETILLHLLRGSGLKGLGGMAPAGEFYIRPLLNCSKEELLAYLERKSVAHLEDESNQDITYLRNRIRHQLLPLLAAEYSPAIRDRLVTLGEVARQDYSFLEKAAQEAMLQMVKEIRPGTWCIDLSAWQREHPALQVQMVMRTLALVRGQDDYTKTDIDAVISLANSQGSAKAISLSQAVKVTREYDRLYLTNQDAPPKHEGYAYQLPVPGEVVVPERGLVISASYQRPRSTITNRVIALKADVCPTQLEVRTRQRGDRIILHGGSKKISDWFVDHKVPYREREHRLLLATQEQVVWIEDGPLALPYQPPKGSRRVWIVVRNL